MGWMKRRRDTGDTEIVVPERTAGGAAVRRVGDVVSLTLSGITFGTRAGAQVSIPGFVPPGFRSLRWISFTSAPVYGQARGLRTLADGTLQIFGLQAGDALQAHVVYFATDPWPEVK